MPGFPFRPAFGLTLAAALSVLPAQALPAPAAAPMPIKTKRLAVREGKTTGQARYAPWSGSVWSQEAGALALGWNGKSSFRLDAHAGRYVENAGVKDEDASPLLKFDRYRAAKTGKSSTAALHELHGDAAAGWHHHVFGSFQAGLDAAGVDYSGWNHEVGWAAAATLVREPLGFHEAQGLRFEAADLKGLLAECHLDAAADVSGQPFRGAAPTDQTLAYHQAETLLAGIDTPESTAPKLDRFVAWYERALGQAIDPTVRPGLKKKYFKTFLQDFRLAYAERYITAYEDIRPEVFHAILMTIIRGQQGTVVFDVATGAEVELRPAYAFESQASLAERFIEGGKQRRRYRVTTTVWLAEPTSAADFIGTRSTTRSYAYDLVTDDGRKPLSGSWTGASVADHPDYAWLPLRNGDRPGPGENAYLAWKDVRALLPAYHATTRQDGLELANTLPGSGQRLTSRSRHGLGTPRSYFQPVAVNTGARLSMLRHGKPTTWRAQYDLVPLQAHATGFRPDRANWAHLGDHTRKAGDAGDLFELDATFPAAEGLYLVLGRMFDRKGKLVDVDELAIRVLSSAQPDDRLEENDSLTVAAPLPEGRTSDLVAMDQDFYRIALPREGEIYVQLTSPDRGDYPDLDIALFRRDGSLVAERQEDSDGEWLFVMGYTLASDDYIVSVTNRGTRVLEYDLEVSLTYPKLTPIDPRRDDALEADNDTPTRATPIAAGEQADLVLLDADHYAVDLSAGEGLEFSLSYERSRGELHVQLITPRGRVVEGWEEFETERRYVLRESGLAAGRYIIKVYSPNQRPNLYAFDLWIGK